MNLRNDDCLEVFHRKLLTKLRYDKFLVDVVFLVDT